MKDYIELTYDNLPKKMEFFRELLYSKAELPLVIYGHCEVNNSSLYNMTLSSIVGWY